MSRGRYSPQQLDSMALDFFLFLYQGDSRAQQLLLRLQLRFGLTLAEVRREIAGLLLEAP